MEIIDIVDDENKMIGKMEKGQAHAENKNYRSASVMLVDRQGRIVMQKRSMKKKLMPGCYSVAVEGHVASGEDIAETAHREMLEEVGFDVELDYVGVFAAETGKEIIFTSLFVGDYDGQEIKMSEREVEGIEFWEIEKVREELAKNPDNFVDAFPVHFENYLKYKNNGENRCSR